MTGALPVDANWRAASSMAGSGRVPARAAPAPRAESSASVEAKRNRESFIGVSSEGLGPVDVGDVEAERVDQQCVGRIGRVQLDAEHRLPRGLRNEAAAWRQVGLAPLHLPAPRRQAEDRLHLDGHGAFGCAQEGVALLEVVVQETKRPVLGVRIGAIDDSLLDLCVPEKKKQKKNTKTDRRK